MHLAFSFAELTSGSLPPQACTPLIYAHPVEIMPFVLSTPVDTSSCPLTRFRLNRFALRAKGKSVTTIVAQASLVTTSYVNSLALAELKWKWFAFVSHLAAFSSPLVWELGSRLFRP